MAGLAGACALVLGGVAGVAIAGAGAAGAAACDGVTPAAGCTSTGTADLSAGALTLVAPATLSWATAVTSLAQQVVDVTPADQTLTVDDATGNAAGWNVSLTATAFTSTVPTAAALADTGTFSINGSVDPLTGLATDSTVPTDVCTVTTECTLPTDGVTTYPVLVNTNGAAVSTIYSATATTGVGSVDLGSIGWWITLPYDTVPGSYASTINLTVGSGP